MHLQTYPSQIHLLMIMAKVRTLLNHQKMRSANLRSVRKEVTRVSIMLQEEQLIVMRKSLIVVMSRKRICNKLFSISGSRRQIRNCIDLTLLQEMLVKCQNSLLGSLLQVTLGNCLVRIITISISVGTLLLVWSRILRERIRRHRMLLNMQTSNCRLIIF